MDALDSGTINVKSWNGNVAMQGSDKDLVVMFYAGTKLNEFKSKAQGVPIYDPVDMIKVFHPGEPLNVPERPVIESDKRRFRDQWDAFKEGKDQKVEGTPLTALFPGKPEIIKTLEAIHIHTVQQLANLSDTGQQNMMFGLNLKQEAQKFLDAHKDTAQYHAIQMALEERDAKIKQLEERLATLSVAPAAPDNSAITALTQLVADLQAKVEKRPGWPKGKPRKPTAESE